jgi:hypothetical protein
MLELNGQLLSWRPLSSSHCVMILAQDGAFKMSSSHFCVGSKRNASMCPRQRDVNVFLKR